DNDLAGDEPGRNRVRGRAQGDGGNGRSREENGADRGDGPRSGSNCHLVRHSLSPGYPLRPERGGPSMAKEARSLHGKVVAITGGARGIGKATAKALARQGAKIAIGDLDKPLAEKTAAELDTDAVGLALDVTDRDSFTRFLDQVAERLGPLDVLINNAGIMPLGPFVDEDDATAR